MAVNAESASRGKRLRLAIVTNIPAPYRVPVYNIIAADPGFEFLAVYAAAREPDRHWNLPPFEHAHVVLQAPLIERNGRYIHNNRDVGEKLSAFAPDVVLTTGFNPTHLRGWAYTLARRCRHVGMTDGTDVSEAGLSIVHKALRQLVYRSSASLVAASVGGKRLLHGYGARDERIHFSPLCANTAVDWTRGAGVPRDIDLLFSARLVDAKNPGFAIDVAADAARQLGRPLRLALLGNGPEEAALRQRAAALAGMVDVQFAGHVAQDDLPTWFHRARLFLFPSSGDTWGVVANEACMAGAPVLVTPQAGVAGELVEDGVTGCVLPLQREPWVQATLALLRDEDRRLRLAQAAAERVRHYSFQNAALGIMDAAQQAVDSHGAVRRGAPFLR